MLEYFLMQTAKCIVAAAVDFIKTGRTIQGSELKVAGIRSWQANGGMTSLSQPPRIPLNS